MVLLLVIMLCMCSGARAHGHSLLVEPQVLADALAQGNGVFVDLRTEKAFNRMHIPGFMSLPFDEDQVRALAGEDRAIYLICTSGRTSAKAYNLLLDAGAQQVHAAVFGVEEYAEAVGLEAMEGEDICAPCILLQKSLDELLSEEAGIPEETAEEEDAAGQGREE
ncbi:MAG: rhodanese-like domain-containing protein [Aristaeellaceae bacterium]